MSVGWKMAKHIFLRGKKGSFDQQEITMAAIALTKREIPLNGELMSHYWPSITDNSTIAGVENIFNIHHAVQIKRKPHQYVHYHNTTITDNSTIVNVKIFSLSMMQSRSEWNLRSFKFWGYHGHHRHHGLHVAESDLMGLLEGGEDKRQVLAADHSHQHSLHL